MRNSKPGNACLPGTGTGGAALLHWPTDAAQLLLQRTPLGLDVVGGNKERGEVGGNFGGYVVS